MKEEMTIDEAFEMLKAIRFNWSIDFDKIPDMYDCIYKQLQAYKDKEDRLRELFEKKPRYDKERHQNILRVGTMEEVLQILNEGDKE